MDIFVIDSHGNVAMFTPSLGVGALLPVAAEFAGSLMWTDADKVEQLEGLSGVFGGSIEEGGSIGFERVFSNPFREKYSGEILTIGLGKAAPIPAEGHVGAKYTWGGPIPIFNLYKFFGLQPRE